MPGAQARSWLLLFVIKMLFLYLMIFFCKDKPIYRAEQRIAGFFSTSVVDLSQWPLLESATATKTEVPFAMHSALLNIHK